MSAWLVDTRRVEIDRFEEVLRAVHERFPALTVKVIREHPHVDALAEIPRQAGLAFDVAINLQNLDELHLTVSHLWVEWFPCGEQHIFEQFVAALCGVLSGSHRIVESLVLGLPVKAVLERPLPSGGWETVATSMNSFAFLIPWPRERRTLCNCPSA